MTPQPASGFVLGGPVSFKLPVYVVREEFEERVFREILNKNYVSIIGSRQVGKTSLLQRIQVLVEERYDQASALIDLSTINEPNVEFRIWAAEFCDRVIMQLKPFIPDDEPPEPPLSPVGFRRYFQALAEMVTRPHILILLDEASAIPSAIGDPFYSIIRWIYTNRTETRPVQPLQKLNFAFAGVFEPERLVKDRNNSPFNVSHVMRVPDFTKPGLESLVSCIEDERVKQNPALVTDAIFEWTAGHPFLSHCFCALVADFLKTNVSSRINSSVVSQIRPSLANVAENNIDHVAKLAFETDELAAIIKQLLRGERIAFSRARPALVRLELGGAISEGPEGLCVIRNRAYEEAFRQAAATVPGATVDVMPVEKLDQAKLREVLITKFSDEELATLCSDLGINYEDIKGATHPDKARELIDYMKRRDDLDRLVSAVKQLRPRAELNSKGA